MRPIAVCVGLLAVLAIGGASTASNRVPSSTAGYNSVSVTGATMTSISYAVAANTITGLTVNFQGSVLLKTVAAQFDTGLPGACVLGVYDATSGQTPATCTGFTQTANRSWKLTITVS